MTREGLRMAEGRRQGGKRGKTVEVNGKILDDKPYYKPKEFGFYRDYNLSH